MATKFGNLLSGVFHTIIVIGILSSLPATCGYDIASVTERMLQYDALHLNKTTFFSLDKVQRMNETKDVEMISIDNTSGEHIFLEVFYCHYQQKICKCNRPTKLSFDNDTVPIKIWILSEYQGEKKLRHLSDSLHECIESKHQVFLRTCNNIIQLHERMLTSDSLSIDMYARCNNATDRHIYICSCLTRSPHSLFRYEHLKTCSVQMSHLSSGRFQMISKTSNLLPMTYVILPKYCINRNEIHKQNMSNEEPLIGRPICFKIIRFVLTTISSLSVVMTMFVFATFKELRNIHSKNMISLSLTLLFSHLICIYEAGNHDPQSCLVIGVLLHYCWLAIFFWISILSYGLMMIYWRRTSLETTLPKTNREYIRHALCSWLGPIPVVLACFFVHFYQLNDSKIYMYNIGQNMCMLSKKTAIYSLVSPMSVYFMTNIVCFILILCRMYSQRNCVIKTWQANEDYICWIFLKIILLLGIYWTMCLVAMYVESMIIWFIFSIIGNLHNLFIFISFVLIRNKTAIVNNHYKNKQRIVSASSCTSNTSNNNKILLQIIAELE